MPPIVKDATSAENGTLLQMPATQRPATEIGGRVQPVALEVPVALNGAHSVDGTNKREPFSERTKTVLVFGNGAVIRLTASVAPGQLLFLTNEKTKREVVCQVVKSKSYRNVSGYVELEFTEAAPGFWGVRFPSDRLGPAKEVPPMVSQAPPEAAKLLDELLAEFAVKPNVPPEESARELKVENNHLQEQLSAILFPEDQKTKILDAPQSVATAEKASPPITTFPAGQHLAEKVSNIPQDDPFTPREVKTQNALQPAVKIDSEMQTGEIEIPAWLKSGTTQLSNRPQNPVAKVELPAAAEPLQANSVSQDSALSGALVEPNDSFVPNFGSGLTPGFHEDSSSSKKGLWIGLVAAVLIVLAGGFWYLQHSRLLASVIASSSSAITAKAESAHMNNPPEVIAAPVSSPTAGDPSANSAETDTTENATVPVPQRQNPVASTGTMISNSEAQSPSPLAKKLSLGKLHLAAPVVHAGSVPNGVVAAPSLSDSQDMPPAATALGASFSDTAVRQPLAPSVPLRVGGNVIPAKLLSSVQPAFPSMAKAQHISGDVKIDALIDANGRVVTMKIISGPALLQKPAMDALRQWKYQPAMLNDSPVSMHLTVTLQFRLQ